jgi:hypothetical protein
MGVDAVQQVERQDEKHTKRKIEKAFHGPSQNQARHQGAD